MGLVHHAYVKDEHYFLISLFLFHHTQRLNYRKLPSLGHSKHLQCRRVHPNRIHTYSAIRKALLV